MRSFDLVLMDLQMPEMDGFEATAAIRAREQGTGVHVPIIAITAHAMASDEARCLAAGMDGYVAKPVKIEAPGAEIRRLVGDERPSSPAPAEGPLDLVSAMGIVGGDVGLLRELAQQFVREYPLGVVELREAIKAGDPRAIERAAHRLKGAVATLGGRPAEAVAGELEMIGRDASLAGAAALLEQLERELTRIATAVTQPDWPAQVSESEPGRGL